jgi:hypothetical protein
LTTSDYVEGDIGIRKVFEYLYCRKSEVRET